MRHQTLTLQLAPEPVISRGAAHDVLNPSVLRRGGTLYAFISEFDGRTWRTALSTSSTGQPAWTPPEIFLSPDPRTWEGAYIAANGSAWFPGEAPIGETWWYWYQAGAEGAPRIGLARSNDAHAWRKEPQPVLMPGPRGSWDERGVGDPDVLRIGAFFYLYYLGQNRAHQQQLGLARSVDGVHWTKLRSNPILTIPWPGSGAPDENGLGEPAVFEARNSYWMLYTGRNAHEQRSLVAAQSNDGVHWTRQPGAFIGDRPWNRQVLCDPAVLTEPGRIRLWFGGGDQPKPAENVNGQIGAGDIGFKP